MATDIDVWINNSGKWIARLRYSVSNNSAGGYSDINYDLILLHQRLYIGARTHSVTIDGTKYTHSYGSISDSTSAAHERILGSGSHRVWHTAAKSVSVSALLSLKATISGTYEGEFTITGTINLPQLAVSPTLPTSISVSGNSGSWVNKDDPRINVSWSGATRGTYTIDRYSVDVAKYGTGSYTNVGNVYTSATSGSVSSESISEMGSLSGGQKLQVRVGMRTSDGTWWGHIYWSGTLNVYSSPSAPTTVSAPSSVEIDNGFSVTWSGASAGSNGIAGYDLQARGYNGSSWTGWVSILSCKNQSSYSVGSIKNLTVNGVNYATYGEGVKFQYRVRASDGTIATSSWANSGTIGITINSPSTPRKPCY